MSSPPENRSPENQGNRPKQAAKLEVLTWGTTPFDSKYWSPIKKRLKGKNAGHGAFTLNLPDDEQYRSIYEKLKAEGYPCTEIVTPLGKKTIENGKEIWKVVATEKRYIVRFSPYWDFAEYGSDQLRQRGRRDVLWERSKFENLSDTEKLRDTLQEDSVPKALSDIAERAREDTTLYTEFGFKENQERPSSGVKQILHVGRMSQKDIQEWNQRNQEASNFLYETVGQPPDKINSIPFKTDKFNFGLDIENLSKEMFKQKRKANEKVYNFIFKKPKDKRTADYPRNDVAIKVELDLINLAIKKGLKITRDPIEFNKLILARDFLDDQKLTEDEKKAVNQFNELLIRYSKYASRQGIFVHDAVQSLFNCCLLVKNTLRKGLDSNYKGYIKQHLTLGVLTFPGELAEQAAALGSAIEKDRMVLLQSDATQKRKFNKPPIFSRIKGYFLRLMNLNYSFLPSRTIVRPLLTLLSPLGMSIEWIVKQYRAWKAKIYVQQLKTKAQKSQEEMAVVLDQKTSKESDINLNKEVGLKEKRKVPSVYDKSFKKLGWMEKTKHYSKSNKKKSDKSSQEVSKKPEGSEFPKR